jgi:hypothetical protein
MTNLTMSLALAYVLLGVSQVTEDLVADPFSKPMWAMRPTFGKMLLVGLTWFTRPFVEAAHSQQVARGIAFAIPIVILSFATLTAYTWVCIIAAEYWFDNLALRICASVRRRAICHTVGWSSHDAIDGDYRAAGRLVAPLKGSRQGEEHKMVQELRASQAVT